MSMKEVEGEVIVEVVLAGRETPTTAPRASLILLQKILIYEYRQKYVI